MGPHSEGFPRMRPSYRCWNSAIIYLVFCLNLHAYICIIEISALRIDGNSGLRLDQLSGALSPQGSTNYGPASPPASGEKSGFTSRKRLVVVIGIVASGVIGLVVFTLTLYYCYRKKRISATALANEGDGKTFGKLPNFSLSPFNPAGSTKSEPPKKYTSFTTGLIPRKPWKSTGIRKGSEQTSISANITSLSGPLNSSTDTVALKRSDLKCATKNFTNQIGEGGFGPVYFGRLPGTQLEVAVKVQAKESRQGAREFATEVEILSRAKHPNLVSLIGYSGQKGAYMLVYEFLGGGTLQDRLYGDRSNPPLDWKSRLRIAVQAAKGLEFLHNDCIPSIIHRDIKTANILLTNSGDAKVTDFGLSKFLEGDALEISKCSVKGTSGYLDPEYYETQKLTHKSDVYSFGIVLLELVSGREPLDIDLPQVEWKIADWIRSYLMQGDLDTVVDKALKGSFNKNSMWMVAELAMTCVEPRSVHRPTIGQVVIELESALKEEGEPLSFSSSLSSSRSTDRP